MVQDARKKGRGFWKKKGTVILRYGFRWIVDTIKGKRNGPDRYCADITTCELFPPKKYYQVLPENRLFFFEEDLGEALNMGLKLII
jgi:hypothetical protein